MPRFDAGLDGVTFESQGCKLLGGFYRAAGDCPRPTALLLHGLPGIEKHLDIAYRLRDRGWNCLYFHFRGSWGSAGSYSLAGLVDDTRAALAWARRQPAVDGDRVALIGGSTGGHAALLCGATDSGVGAIVALCPFIEPRAFHFPAPMAEEFAGMLHGVTGQGLLEQWQHMESLAAHFPALASRPLLLASGDRDELVPPAHYAEAVAALPGLRWARHPEADHSFSTCRPWLVQTVTDWLVELPAPIP
jgi:fermentation-respiration switch protein FrsA (DUF1100 family)